MASFIIIVVGVIILTLSLVASLLGGMGVATPVILAICFSYLAAIVILFSLMDDGDYLPVLPVLALPTGGMWFALGNPTTTQVSIVAACIVAYTVAGYAGMRPWRFVLTGTTLALAGAAVQAMAS